jgi:prepilin-type N-terminal cleavage/methylation domain-containing protein
VGQDGILRAGCQPAPQILTAETLSRGGNAERITNNPMFSAQNSASLRLRGELDAPSGRKPSRTSGITLIELLVVMTIIAVIVGVSFPAASAGMDSVRLASATQSTAAFLNSAVNRAERRQEALELAISPKENSMTLYSNEPGFQREFHLPDGITLDAALPAIAEESDPVRRILLLPGAAVPGIGIQLSNRHGSRRIVRLDPMTGFPRVESVEAK